MSVSPGAIGGFGANHHLRQCLVFLNMPTLQQPEAYVGGIGDGRHPTYPMSASRAGLIAARTAGGAHRVFTDQPSSVAGQSLNALRNVDSVSTSQPAWNATLLNTSPIANEAWIPRMSDGTRRIDHPHRKNAA